MTRRLTEKLPAERPSSTRAARFEAVGEEFLVVSFPVARRRAQPATLTSAEKEVYDLILRGLSNQQIATTRGSASRTIANQVASIFRKTGVRSRIELLARFAQ
jgi:DNA-binding NarL/FixJ family response regulator